MARSTPLPTTIGRFKVEARLGAGGMGEVYKAYDATLHRTIAVKTVRPDIDNPTYLDRLYREAQAGARLQHPNIVTVFEAGEVDGLVYIAMEYLKGENLALALERGELSFETRIKIVMEILGALQYAHSEGVIHRDIKPANVLRLPDGSIKLLDFGLARITRAESLTQTGAMMGTPYYASPEQLKGEEVDPRTDIYSAGVMAYELLTGRRAFDGDNTTVVMFKVLSEPPPPMETSWSNTFPEIERIVTRAMAKSAGDRYATAEDMRNALAAFLSTSREALSGMQAEQKIYAQRAVIEAKTLIAKGEISQARELLSQILRANPEAAAVRTLLKDTSVSPAPPNAQPVAAPQSQGKAPLTANDPTIVRPQTRSVAEAAGPAVNVPDVPLPPTSTLVAPPPQGAVEGPTVVVRDIPAAPRRTIVWALAAAAVAVAAVTVWIVSNRGGSPTSREGVDPRNLVVDAKRPEAGLPVASPSAAQPVPVPAAPGAGGGATASIASAPETGARGALPAPSDPGIPASAKPASKPAGTPPAAVATTPVKGPDAAESAGAKKLFVENGSRNLGLRYAIVQQTAGGETEVTPDTTFHSGDRVRFMFEPNVDGYLFLVQEGSSGKWDLLFPSALINGGINAVRKGQKYTIPSEGWFRFDNIPGTERAFVFLSKEPLSSLPGFKAPVTKNEAVGQTVVDDLKSRVKSRDLVFETEKPADSGGAGPKNQSMFVVNRDELGKSVSATIQLVHQ
jgi:serine/threonine protein kinase